MLNIYRTRTRTLNPMNFYVQMLTIRVIIEQIFKINTTKENNGYLSIKITFRSKSSFGRCLFETKWNIYSWTICSNYWNNCRKKLQSSDRISLSLFVKKKKKEFFSIEMNRKWNLLFFDIIRLDTKWKFVTVHSNGILKNVTNIFMIYIKVSWNLSNNKLEDQSAV